jgi:hypothetical protein
MSAWQAMCQMERVVCKTVAWRVGGFDTGSASGHVALPQPDSTSSLFCRLLICNGFLCWQMATDGRAGLHVPDCTTTMRCGNALGVWEAGGHRAGSSSPGDGQKNTARGGVRAVESTGEVWAPRRGRNGRRECGFLVPGLICGGINLQTSAKRWDRCDEPPLRAGIQVAQAARRVCPDGGGIAIRVPECRRHFKSSTCLDSGVFWSEFRLLPVAERRRFFGLAGHGLVGPCFALSLPGDSSVASAIQRCLGGDFCVQLLFGRPVTLLPLAGGGGAVVSFAGTDGAALRLNNCSWRSRICRAN